MIFISKKGILSIFLAIAILFSFSVFSPVAGAATITLSPITGDDTAQVTQAILDIDDGGTIYFNPGTYDVNLTIYMDDVNKSFSLVGIGGAESTVLDGSGDTAHVMRIYANSPPRRGPVTIDGFTIQNGNGDGTSGGGIYLFRCTATVKNCVIKNNTANVGGGMYAYDCSLDVLDCVFSNNTTLSQGGAVYISLSRGVFERCSFTDNSAGWGGGVYDTTPRTSFYSCVFDGNSASERGGGVYIDENRAMFQNCVFTSNTANVSGGGIYSSTNWIYVYNSTFSQNNTGAYISYYSSSYTGEVTNCIFWGNGSTRTDNFNESGYVDVTYCDLFGGHAGEGNINEDPLFRNAPVDVSLSAESPCIDAGADLSGIPLVEDISGVTRPQGEAYDMGAYECTPPGTTIWSPVTMAPIVQNALARTSMTWETLSESLPSEPSLEMAGLIEQIGIHMSNAAQLSNPVYVVSELSYATDALEELTALI